jgi:hypothetical protein
MWKALAFLAFYLVGSFCAFQYGRAYERSFQRSLGKVEGTLSVALVDASGAPLQPSQDKVVRLDLPSGNYTELQCGRRYNALDFLPGTTVLSIERPERLPEDAAASREMGYPMMAVVDDNPPTHLTIGDAHFVRLSRDGYVLAKCVGDKK